MGDTGSRLVEPEEQLFWPSGLAHLGAFQPELAGQRLPRIGLRLWGDAHQLERGAGLATEVFEIEAQDAEERDPPVGVTLELVVPVISAGEPAVDDTDDTGSS